ncbi:MAG: hypothetical protein HDQ96_12100 [Lachnospiraceae bacterium]|nr:hypothetical protein [Lachnospiraceae bacterium]
MIKQYVFPPKNWAEVSRGMIVSKEEKLKALLQEKRWYFYDTCALMHHARPGCSEAMIRYIKKHQGVVILLQTIVMELNSIEQDNIILQGHREYIRKIIDNDIPVIFMPEEDCCGILPAVMKINRGERNERFTYAIRQLRGGNSGIGKALDALSDADKKQILNGKPVLEELGDNAIKKIRAKKQEKDSMGEEMIFYCMIMLASLLHPMVVLSDDKSAFDRFCRTETYIKEHYQRKEIQYYSSVHLCHMMYQQGILSENEVENFLKAAYGEGMRVSFRGITARDVDTEEKVESIEDIAKLICEDKELRILI